MNGPYTAILLETTMCKRVPILRENHMVKIRNNGCNPLLQLLSAVDIQCTIRIEKIILIIDYY